MTGTGSDDRSGGPSRWPVAVPIATVRLDLEPLRPEHAVELAGLLDDPALHEYIGGQPATLAELQARYAVQAAGHSPDGGEGWLNWVVRERAGAYAVGTVQATLTVDAVLCADLAWVIATRYQRRGYAVEAAAAMAGWLRGQGAQVLAAYVHPDHGASIRVAQRLGLTATGTVVEGEIRWAAGPG